MFRGLYFFCSRVEQYVLGARIRLESSSYMAIVNNGSRMNILIFNEILMYLVYNQINIMSLFLHDSFNVAPEFVRSILQQRKLHNEGTLRSSMSTTGAECVGCIDDLIVITVY
jgi:hypothetical protein